jgi:hypothetical protein
MRAVDVVLETLAHFVKMEGGPPPGIPVRVESDFERKLVRLCEWHGVAPLFLDSLEKLALDAPLSEVTLERMKTLSRLSAARNEKYLAALRSLSHRLRERRVPFLLLDDVLAALKLYPRHRLRPIERLDVLIHANDWDLFVGACRAMGYRREARDPNFENGKDAMIYHQYFSPCVLRGEREVSIGVKFRVIDVGPPAPDEAAWALGKRLGRDIEAMRLSYEDQFIRSCVAFNMTGFGKLLHAVDAGRILARHGEELDWSYIEGLSRDGSFYPAVYLSHQSIVNLFQLPAKRRPLSPPGRFQKSFYEIVWRPGRTGVLAEHPPSLHRHRFSLTSHGTWGDRLKWMGAVISPRSEWVSGYFGRPANPWLRLKFVSLVLRNRLSPSEDGDEFVPEAQAPRDLAGTGRVGRGGRDDRSRGPGERRGNGDRRRYGRGERRWDRGRRRRSPDDRRPDTNDRRAPDDRGPGSGDRRPPDNRRPLPNDRDRRAAQYHRDRRTDLRDRPSLPGNGPSDSNRPG